MTDQEIIDYYAGLLIIQYVGKPKAFATIQALATLVIMNQLPLAVQNAFNIVPALGPLAQGVQLDIIGKYVGVSRNANTFTGPITLDDSQYLTLINMKIAQNNSGSSLATIQAFLAQFFPGGQILVFDYANMAMSYLISSSVGNQALIEVFVTSGLLPKPMGVALASVIYAPVITTFFGFRTYFIPAHNSSPFNDYTSYNTSYPWLTYADAI